MISIEDSSVIRIGRIPAGGVHRADHVADVADQPDIQGIAGNTLAVRVTIGMSGARAGLLIVQNAGSTR